MLCVAVAHVGGGADPHGTTAQYQCNVVKNADGDYSITLTDSGVTFIRVFPTYAVVDTTGGAHATVEMDYASGLTWNLKIRRGAALVDDVHVHVLFVDLEPN
jgi:hypothetical protein